MSEKKSLPLDELSSSGEGYIMLFHFQPEFVEKNGFLFEHLKGNFIGGFGLIFVVNHKQSPVGEFQEIIFIPGQFKLQDKEFYSMTKVFTSTPESAEYRKSNWGIPAEAVHFNWEFFDDNSQKINVFKNEKESVSFSFKSYSPGFPISTRFIPNTNFAQVLEDKIFHTNIIGSGKAKFASLKEFSVHPSFFVDIQGIKHWATVRVDDFNLKFSESVIEKLAD